MSSIFFNYSVVFFLFALLVFIISPSSCLLLSFPVFPNPESRIKQEISRGFRLHPRTTPQNGKVAYQKVQVSEGAVAFSQIIFASHSMFSIDKVDESFVK